MHIQDTPQFPLRATIPHMVPLPFNFLTDGAGDIVQASSDFPSGVTGVRNGVGIYEITIPNNWKVMAAVLQPSENVLVVTSEPSNTVVRFTLGAPANSISKRHDGVIWVTGAQI